MTTKTLQFPIVDALLETPTEGSQGAIGICTNTTAPGQVLNEIEPSLRKDVSVLGSLIVSRDGAERMILNSIAHPTMTYLILFSEESLTFSPSTNLLLAVQRGIDAKKPGNHIVGGQAASPHYPNLSEKIVGAFRNNIIVLPLFMYKSGYSQQIVADYIKWLKPKVHGDIYTFLKEANGNKKIYFNALNQFITLLKQHSAPKKETIKLDPKEFQHLQPPIIDIDKKTLRTLNVPFSISRKGKEIRVDIVIDNVTHTIRHSNDFLLSYSLMIFLGKKKKQFTPLQQLTLGAELARVGVEMQNDISLPPFSTTQVTAGKKEIAIEPKVNMVPDQKYYYKIGIRDKKTISVICLAFDVCEEVFELRSEALGGIFEWLALKNRFEDYDQDFLHHVDVGVQTARAAIAAELGYAFMQDFPSIFKVNKETLPLCIADGDSFLDVHKQVLMNIYTKGLTEEHGDKHKGLARTAVMLAVYRNTQKSLKTLPMLYKQGEYSPKEMREAYKKQLLRFDHDGDYSYGERTRSFFGFDQLTQAITTLKKNPSRALLIQRFDPSQDMESTINADTGKYEYSHDPCLTHDIFFIKEGKLHSFHIARAHNTVNAYPENIFGLYDAYVETLREGLSIPGGDMYMLSSRANILLLIEEQRTKTIIAEPSKPGSTLDTVSGPYLLGKNIKAPKTKGSIAYIYEPIKKVTRKPKSSIIDRLENYERVDTIERAVNYLKQKGVMHNNPILTQYHAGSGDSQGNYLVFFQANVFGGKVHATTVFMNHSLEKRAEDEKIIGYLATKYSKALGYPLGELSLFYVVY